MRLANEKASKNVVLRGNVPKSTVSNEYCWNWIFFSLIYWKHTSGTWWKISRWTMAFSIVHICCLWFGIIANHSKYSNGLKWRHFSKLKIIHQSCQYDNNNNNKNTQSTHTKHKYLSSIHLWNKTTISVTKMKNHSNFTHVDTSYTQRNVFYYSYYMRMSKKMMMTWLLKLKKIIFVNLNVIYVFAIYIYN